MVLTYVDGLKKKFRMELLQKDLGEFKSSNLSNAAVLARLLIRPNQEKRKIRLYPMKSPLIVNKDDGSTMRKILKMCLKCLRLVRVPTPVVQPALSPVARFSQERGSIGRWL